MFYRLLTKILQQQLAVLRWTPTKMSLRGHCAEIDRGYSPEKKFKAPQMTSTEYVPLLTDLVFSVRTVSFEPRLGDKSTEKNEDTLRKIHIVAFKLPGKKRLACSRLRDSWAC